MLLRLLPLATPTQPAPPTILFTLPLATHPYTSKSLPLPPNLLAHRSVCLQEDIDCSNVLLGEKASWIAGIIDDVTFSLPAQNVTISFIDESTLELPLTHACLAALRMVIHEVQLSFAPPPPPSTPKPELSPRTSISSIASTSSSASSSSSSPRRRSPSAILYSILSPLLAPNEAECIRAPLPAQPPARLHRRQARSLLVDTYRRHVLPLLREHLPSAYLPWKIASETRRLSESFEQLRVDINQVLANSDVDLTELRTPMKRSRSSSASSSDDSVSDSDSDAQSPITPATSVFSHSACSTPQRIPRAVTPQSFLLSIPPAHDIPSSHRNIYAAQLAALTRIASRLSAIRKLSGRYEREEGKRRWLESLERGRAGDRALRRAFSNGQIAHSTATANARPTVHSKLYRSWSYADQIRAESKPIHPAMASSDEELDDPFASEHDIVMLEERPLPPLPRRSSLREVSIPATPNLACDVTGMFHDTVVIQPVRPPLKHRDAIDRLPALVPSLSDESLTDEWDDVALLPPPPIADRWTTHGLAKQPTIDWEHTELDSTHIEFVNGIQVVVAA